MKILQLLGEELNFSILENNNDNKNNLLFEPEIKMRMQVLVAYTFSKKSLKSFKKKFVYLLRIH